MQHNLHLRSWLSAGIAAAALSWCGGASAADVPDFMKPIAGQAISTPAQSANGDVLALNAAMFDLYGNSGRIFQSNILAQHPVILGLFSGAGGRFILYRPGMPPLEAPSVPLSYQLLKSVGHSTMALAEVVAPYVDNPGNQSWRGAMTAYRSRMQSALGSVDAAELPAEWRANNRAILQNNIAFMDGCLAKDAVSQVDLNAFGKGQAPYLAKNVNWAAHVQVTHWMDVIGGWKAMMGSDWDKTYAASNTIYVTRQNNVLFSVLAQYFPPEAINDRLLLIETVSFTTTPEDMLEGLTRIISDRSVGSIFFGSYHLMDYELMGGDARAAIVEESAKRGMKPFLPPAVPFGSHQWPTLITPGSGPASIADLK
jgi:hypothetical protein